MKRNLLILGFTALTVAILVGIYFLLFRLVSDPPPEQEFALGDESRLQIFSLQHADRLSVQVRRLQLPVLHRNSGSTSFGGGHDFVAIERETKQKRLSAVSFVPHYPCLVMDVCLLKKGGALSPGSFYRLQLSSQELQTHAVEFGKEGFFSKSINSDDAPKWFLELDMGEGDWKKAIGPICWNSESKRCFVSFPFYLRTNQELRFRLVESDGTSRTFQVKNPGYRQPSAKQTGKPATIPIQANLGEFVLEISGLRRNNHHQSPFWSPGIDEKLIPKAPFRDPKQWNVNWADCFIGDENGNLGGYAEYLPLPEANLVRVRRAFKRSRFYQYQRDQVEIIGSGKEGTDALSVAASFKRLGLKNISLTKLKAESSLWQIRIDGSMQAQLFDRIVKSNSAIAVFLNSAEHSAGTQLLWNGSGESRNGARMTNETEFSWKGEIPTGSIIEIGIPLDSGEVHTDFVFRKSDFR